MHQAAMRHARILILEDQHTEIRALRQALQPAHDLTFVQDVGAALELLRAESFEMVISRVYLERQDPFGLLHAMQAEEKLRAIPFIGFSARQTDVARRLNPTLSKTFMGLGAVSFLDIDTYVADNKLDSERLRLDIERYLPSDHRAN